MKNMTLSPLQPDNVTKSEFNEFKDDIRLQFQEFRAEMKADYERHAGMLLEIFQHNLKAAMEQIDAKLDKKLDKEEFYAYMDLYVRKPARRR